MEKNIHEVTLTKYAAKAGVIKFGTWGSRGIEQLHITALPPWNEAAVSSDPEPLRYRNKRLSGCKVLHQLHHDGQMRVKYNPMLYILLPQKSHADHRTGKKMHPVHP